MVAPPPTPPAPSATRTQNAPKRADARRATDPVDSDSLRRDLLLDLNLGTRQSGINQLSLY